MQRSNSLLRGITGAALAFAACHGGATTGTMTSAPPAPVAAPTSPTTTITTFAKPNGLAWDAAHTRLLVADEATFALAPWTDHGDAGAPVALVASPVEKDGLGGVAIAPDGSALVARFGGGSAGGILRVAPGGAVAAIAGLEPTRRRLGVTVAGDGSIYAAWFVRGPGSGGGKGKQAGIEHIDAGGAVSDVATELDKPVGVVAAGNELWISDQGANTLSRCALPDCTNRAVVATVDGPDLLAAAPGGGVLVATSHGELVRVDESGAETTIARGLVRPRGLAVDTAGGRVFVADRDAGGHGVVRVVALTPAKP